MQIQQAGAPVNLTSSGAVSATSGILLGWYVNSTSAGTIALLNGGSGGAAITGTITPAIGWHTFPVGVSSVLGLYATIGGTLNVTFVFAAGG